MRLIVLTENPSLLLALGSIRPDWDLATANSPSELSHLAARAAVGLMDLGTTKRGLDQLERMKEAGVTLPWVVVGDSAAPEEAEVKSIVKPFILANLAEELERTAGVSPVASSTIPEPETISADRDSPRLLRRMKAWASEKKPEPKEPAAVEPPNTLEAPEQSKPMQKAEVPAETPAPPPTKPQPRWKVVEPEAQEVVASGPAPPTESGYLPAPSPTEAGAILPSRRGFRERFSRKPRAEQVSEEKAGYELGPSGYPSPPPEPMRQEIPRIPKLPRHKGNGHIAAPELQGDSLQDKILSASGAAAALEHLLEEMPGLEDPSVIGNAIVAEVVETLSPDIVALYAASPNGTYVLIASYGLTKTEERIIVPGDHPFFREIASLRQAVMVSPVDLVQGLVAGIAGARTDAFMASPFVQSGKCLAILVVGGEFGPSHLDRLAPITKDGTEGLALSLRLATLSHHAVQRGA